MVRIELEKLKKELELSENRNNKNVNKQEYIRKGDVYLADLGEYNGNIQGGIRPVVVTSNNSGNRHSDIITVLPFSTKLYKMKLPTHVFVAKEECDLAQDSFIMAEQIRTINKSALKGYIGYMDSEKINKVIKISQGIERVYTDREQVLVKKVKELKGLEMIISGLLDKYDNKIIEPTQKFIDDRHNLLLDIKNYCNNNNLNLNHYYKFETHKMELAI